MGFGPKQEAILHVLETILTNYSQFYMGRTKYSNVFRGIYNI